MTSTFTITARRTAKILMFTAAILATAATFRAANAQTVCAQHEAVAGNLTKQFGERLSALGLDAGGNMIELYSSETGTWTITVTRPGGPTCILSAGESWMQEAVKTVAKEERTS